MAEYSGARIAGHEARVYAVTDSTNLRAKELARDGAANGLIVIANEQTNGRGRLNRNWLSRAGAGAWFSCLVRPDAQTVRAQRAPGLVFVCALAMARALRAKTDAQILVKWPNDLVIHGKKLAGILCEMGAQNSWLSWAVLGIGVNLSGNDFPDSLPCAASVEGETGVRVERDACIAAFLREFDALYPEWLAQGLSPILRALGPISATLGRRVRATSDEVTITGEALRFAEDGALVVFANGEERVLRAGDVSVRGEMGYQ